MVTPWEEIGQVRALAPGAPQRPPNTHSAGSQFCASQAYESSHADELSVPAGARVRVLETSDRGWWLCRCKGEGLGRGPGWGGRILRAL